MWYYRKLERISARNNHNSAYRIHFHVSVSLDIDEVKYIWNRKYGIACA